MRYMLDTHTLIWFFEKNPRISSKAQSIIDDKNNIVHVSIASLWEIAIKVSLGKLDISLTTDELLERIDEEDFLMVNILSEHLRIIQSLPHHHRDPFDRMIIAQADAEKCTIISIDNAFDAYSTSVLW